MGLEVQEETVPAKAAHRLAQPRQRLVQPPALGHVDVQPMTM
jgi:hypothetical protein